MDMASDPRAFRQLHRRPANSWTRMPAFARETGGRPRSAWFPTRSASTASCRNGRRISTNPNPATATCRTCTRSIPASEITAAPARPELARPRACRSNAASPPAAPTPAGAAPGPSASGRACDDGDMAHESPRHAHEQEHRPEPVRHAPGRQRLDLPDRRQLRRHRRHRRDAGAEPRRRDRLPARPAQSLARWPREGTARPRQRRGGRRLGARPRHSSRASAQTRGRVRPARAQGAEDRAHHAQRPRGSARRRSFAWMPDRATPSSSRNRFRGVSRARAAALLSRLFESRPLSRARREQRLPRDA